MRIQTSITVSEISWHFLEGENQRTGVPISKIIDGIVMAQQETPREKIRKICVKMIAEEMTEESRKELLNIILKNLDKI